MQPIEPINNIEKPDLPDRPKEDQDFSDAQISNTVLRSISREPVVVIENSEPQNSRFLFLNYLITLFAGIGSVFSLALISYGVLDSWFYGEEAMANGGVLYVVAGLLITAPLFMLASKKLIGDSDQSQPGVWPVGASHASLAFGIIGLISVAAGLAAWLLFVIFELISGTSSLAGKNIALTLLGVTQAAIWMLLGARLLLGLRKSGQDNLLTTVFGGLAIIVIILAFAFPIRLDRNVKIDARTVSDLTAIQTAISNRGYLPNSLKDLKSIKDKGVESRLGQYTYKTSSTSNYELCAKFETNTTEDESGSPEIINPSPLAALGGRSSDYSSFYRGYGFDKHKKGQECFKLSIYPYNTGDDYDAESGLDYELDPNSDPEVESPEAGTDDSYDALTLPDNQSEDSSSLRSN